MRGKRKKCVAGAGLSSVGRAAFLYNVIIGQCTLSFWKTEFFYCPIMPHYVKKLWEKFLLPITILYRRIERLAYKNFLERWQVVENGGLKR
jgi:hypothetical protein